MVGDEVWCIVDGVRRQAKVVEYDPARGHWGVAIDSPDCDVVRLADARHLTPCRLLGECECKRGAVLDCY